MGRFTIGLLVLGLAVVTAQAQDAPAVPGSETMDAMLERVEVKEGREYKAITFFPLVLREDAQVAELDVVSLDRAAKRGEVLVREPKWPARRYNVEVEIQSKAERPIFVPGGTILVGGRLDRMVAEDVILPPNSTLEIATIPAEYPRDLRRGKDIVPRFDVSSYLAAPYLRRQALFDPNSDLVPRFVSHFLGFRLAGDDRRSLVAVSESPDLARGIRAYQDAFGNLPKLYEGRVVGWVAVVGGRVHGMEIFGSNRLAADHFPAMLRAHAFPTTAMTLRADKLGIKLPEPGDAESAERFRPEVDAFLAAIRKSERRCGIKPKGTLGDSCLLRKSRARGEAVALEGRLVHAGAVADLPFQERLYGRPLPAPPGEENGETYGSLERQDEGEIPGRRLTEFEKRLLERMRSRRPNR